MSLNAKTLIEQLLAAAEISASSQEVAAFAAATPERLAAIEQLYAVEEARHEDPSLVFTAEPPPA